LKNYKRFTTPVQEKEYINKWVKINNKKIKMYNYRTHEPPLPKGSGFLISKIV